MTEMKFFVKVLKDLNSLYFRYCKVPKFSDTRKHCCNHPKIEKGVTIAVFSLGIFFTGALLPLSKKKIRAIDFNKTHHVYL